MENVHLRWNYLLSTEYFFSVPVWMKIMSPVPSQLEYTKSIEFCEWMLNIVIGLMKGYFVRSDTHEAETTWCWRINSVTIFSLSLSDYAMSEIFYVSQSLNFKWIYVNKQTKKQRKLKHEQALMLVVSVAVFSIWISMCRWSSHICIAMLWLYNSNESLSFSFLSRVT